MNKNEIRKEYLAKREALSREEIQEMSETICSKVLQSAAYLTSSDVCIYMPIRGEVDLTGIVAKAQEDGKTLCIPAMLDDEMEFNMYEGEENLREGKYGIPESTSEVFLLPDYKTLVIMPGAAFSADGGRIGYGGGYYDRYLSRYPACRTIGVCYDFQVVDSIPAESHDASPEIIITEKEIYEVV